MTRQNIIEQRMDMDAKHVSNGSDGTTRTAGGWCWQDRGEYSSAGSVSPETVLEQGRLKGQVKGRAL